MGADEVSRESLRAADSDRNEVADQLRRAVDEGRLSMFEYDERLRDTYAAATYGELARVTSDLPDYRHERVAEEKRKKAWREYSQEWLQWLGGAVIMNGIWLFTGLFDDEPGMHNYWPAIPLGIWAVILVAGVFDRDDDKKDDKKDEKKSGKDDAE